MSAAKAYFESKMLPITKTTNIKPYEVRLISSFMRYICLFVNF